MKSARKERIQELRRLIAESGMPRTAEILLDQKVERFAKNVLGPAALSDNAQREFRFAR